jgi:hypothetical protein
MDVREHYVRTWQLVLTHLAGWSDRQIREWVQHWEPQLNDVNSTMYHELPVYYVAGCVIPSDLNPQTCIYWPLVSKVMRAIGNPPVDGIYDWDTAKVRVQAAIDEARRR